MVLSRIVRQRRCGNPLETGCARPKVLLNPHPEPGRGAGGAVRGAQCPLHRGRRSTHQFGLDRDDATLRARVAMIHHPDAGGGYLLNRLAYVREQIRVRPGLVWTNQYKNDANPRAHRERTAPELWGQIQRPADSDAGDLYRWHVGGFSTVRPVAADSLDCRGVDVEGSLALADERLGKRLLPGIGSSPRLLLCRTERRRW